MLICTQITHYHEIFQDKPVKSEKDYPGPINTVPDHYGLLLDLRKAFNIWKLWDTNKIFVQFTF